MDICEPNWNEDKNSSNAYDNCQYFYSGNLLSHHHLHSIYHHCIAVEMTMDSQRITTETQSKATWKMPTCAWRWAETVCAAEKWKLYTNSFKIQDHSIECVQAENLFSHLGQQE